MSLDKNTLSHDIRIVNEYIQEIEEKLADPDLELQEELIFKGQKHILTVLKRKLAKGFNNFKIKTLPANIDTDLEEVFSRFNLNIDKMLNLVKTKHVRIQTCKEEPPVYIDENFIIHLGWGEYIMMYIDRVGVFKIVGQKDWE